MKRFAKTAFLSVLTLIVALSAAPSAKADWDDRRGLRYEEGGRDNHHWHHHHYSRYEREPVYYPAAPVWIAPHPRVVYAPQPYYVAPYPAGFNVLLNLR